MVASFDAGRTARATTSATATSRCGHAGPNSFANPRRSAIAPHRGDVAVGLGAFDVPVGAGLDERRARQRGAHQLDRLGGQAGQVGERPFFTLPPSR